MPLGRQVTFSPRPNRFADRVSAAVGFADGGRPNVPNHSSSSKPTGLFNLCQGVHGCAWGMKVGLAKIAACWGQLQIPVDAFFFFFFLNCFAPGILPGKDGNTYNGDFLR